MEGTACTSSQTQQQAAQLKEHPAVKTAMGAQVAEAAQAVAAAEDHATNREVASQAKAAAPARGLKELCSGVSWVPAVVLRLVLGGRY